MILCCVFSDLFLGCCWLLCLPQLLSKKRKIALFDALEKVKSGKRLSCILFYCEASITAAQVEFDAFSSSV